MSYITNKNIGESFEKDFLRILKSHGFWATKLKEKENGGPFDIIATNSSGLFFGIEAKNIMKGTRFPLSRVEPNQEMSIQRLAMLGVKNCWFVFSVNSHGVYLLPALDVIYCKDKSIDVVKEGIELENWFEILPF